MDTTVRTEQEIFAALRELCSAPGYAHAIALICVRDNTIMFDNEVTAADMSRMSSSDRLLRTEISLLIGLLAQNPVNFDKPDLETVTRYVSETDALCSELHDAIMQGSNLASNTFLEKVASGQNPFAHGEAMREPMFYGAESAYPFQYRELSVKKYARDIAWLKENKGFTPTISRDIAAALMRMQNSKLQDCLDAIRHGSSPSDIEFLTVYEFSVNELADESHQSKEDVAAFLSAFTIPVENRNEQFTSVHEFNVTNAFPVLRRGDLYVLFQINSLLESMYESPFFWMFSDPQYKATASKNRGDFAEYFSIECFDKVFGSGNVFLNVEIYDSKKRLGEIDVLVLFANRAIVLQAKSKKLTLEARKGLDANVKMDFKNAVQDAYSQGFSSASLLAEKKYRLVCAGTGAEIANRDLKEIFLICLVSEHYPALSFQAHEYLELKTSQIISPPFVMDVFLLDALTEMLDSPLRVLSYIKRRTQYADRITASHELTVLSFHLKRNLWINKGTDMLMLSDEISSDLDVAMSVRRDGMQGQRTPDGILTKLRDTHLGKVIDDIESVPSSATIDLGFLLLSLGEDTVRLISEALTKITSKARSDSQNHDLSIPMKDINSGLTIHCNNSPFSESGENLRSHCTARKYTERAASWFGLCMSPENTRMRFVLQLEYPWEYNAQAEEQTRHMAKPIPLKKAVKVLNKKAKIGRNEKCPCGSDKKYKHCCLPAAW